MLVHSLPPVGPGLAGAGSDLRQSSQRPNRTAGYRFVFAPSTGGIFEAHSSHAVTDSVPPTVRKTYMYNSPLLPEWAPGDLNPEPTLYESDALTD